MIKKAFTLVEVLSVISIIAILASIGVYSVNTYKEDANLKKTIAYAEKVKLQLADSLLAEWQMNEGEGSYLYDSGRFGYTSDYKSSTAIWQTSDCVDGNSCLKFENGDVEFSSLENQKFKTMCFWLKVNNQNYQEILYKGNNYSEGYKGDFVFSIDSPNNKVITSVCYDDDCDFVSKNDLAVLEGVYQFDNNWHFICNSLNDSNLYIIIDGELINSGPVQTNFFGGNQSFDLNIGIGNIDFYIDDLILFKDSIIE